MKLSEYTDWKAAAAAHWDPIIAQVLANVADQQWQPEYDPADDISRLQSDLRSHLDAVDAPVAAYRDDNSRRGPFIDVLLSQLFYINVAVAQPSPLEPVAAPSLIDREDGSDLRRLFAWWRQDLPDFTSFFQVLYNGTTQMPTYDPLTEPPTTSVVGTFSLGTTEAFSAALAAFSGYVGDDLGRLQQLPQQVQANTRDRVAYGIFAGREAVIEPNPVDNRTYLLEDMHGQKVLDEFNWSIRGLNL